MVAPPSNFLIIFFIYNQVWLWLGLVHTTRVCCRNVFKTGNSVIAVLWDFCTHFMFRRNDAALNRKSIVQWITNFRTMGSTIKRKLSRRIKICYSPKMWGLFLLHLVYMSKVLKEKEEKFSEIRLTCFIRKLASSDWK